MTGNRSLEFVDLNRTFHELSAYVRQTDEADLSEAFRTGPTITWADLKAERRTILLAEAGTGKTVEIRQAALRWRAGGDHAFFLRLEHVADDLDTAFEVGDLSSFEQWKNSSDEGWVLLDSVDEARLRSAGDFERAIRRFGGRVRGAEDRLHLIITSRMSAWRPKSDLDLCERILPPPAKGRRADPEDSEADLSGSSSDISIQSDRTGRSPRYRVVTLDDLDRTRIQQFASAAGIDAIDQFLEAVDRKDAWQYTRRPQDLEELIEFWRRHGRLGSRMELVQSSVARRLEERDQTRAEGLPISTDRVRSGATRIAAACVLSHEATIQVPDGSASGSGLKLADILPGWDPREVGALLSRPLFDEAIYGAVRFHHREAREFLAAEWFAGLLQRETSRTKIEAIFFRQQYGLDVIVPSMRPVLPWLALLDDRIRDRLLRVAPQVLFEGGDPSHLPKPIREMILRECCRGLAETTTPRTFTDFAAVQRFAAPDLVDAIRELLRLYQDSNEVRAFLCRMVWIGVLPDLRSEMKAIALCNEASAYTKIVTIRALASIHAAEDLKEIRRSVIEEGSQIDRDLLAALLTATLFEGGDVQWLAVALRSAYTPRDHAVRGGSVSRYSVSVPLSGSPAG